MVLFRVKREEFFYDLNGEDVSQSKFDSLLYSLWDQAMLEGRFWYSLDCVQRRILQGRYNMILQLNEKRFEKRRKPEVSTQIQMPFDRDKFNFNKIKPDEILMDLQSEDSPSDQLKDRIVINVSPIDSRHVLLVPDCTSEKPQVLDLHAIAKAVELCLLSTSLGICVGFNSLCALASVNHQHFHLLYIDHTLPLTLSRVKRVSGELFTLEHYSVNGYALQLQGDDVMAFARSLMQLTSYFCHHNIAHNVVLCRRRAFDVCTIKHLVTAFVFPKTPSPESTGRPFHVACLELAGYFLIKDREQFDELTESAAVSILNEYTYNDQSFNLLTETLLKSCHFS